MNIKLSADDARNIIWDEHPDWKKVDNSEEVIDHSRWSVIYKAIFKNLKNNKFYSVGWSVGATEMQDELPFEYEKEVEFFEVHQVEKLIKVWENV